MASIGTSIPTNPSIIIVGSGAAGIAAATKLLKNGFTNIKILEAENRIGGRIESVKFGDGYVDFGAEFCDGEDNVIYSTIKDLDILRPLNKKLNFLLSNGETIKSETALKIIKFASSVQAGDKFKDDGKNVTSVGEYLDIYFKKLLTTIKDPKEKEILARSPDWVKSYLCLRSSPFDLNDLHILTDYKSCAGAVGTFNGLGFKTVLEALMQKYPTTENQLPIDDKILFQKEVNKIDNWQNGEKVTITTSDGSKYEADHVILTQSVGVLKADFKTLFNPPLPEEKVDAIKNIGYGAGMKIVIHFPERWWKDDASWSFVWTAEDEQELKEKNLEWLVSVLGLDQAPNNSNVVIGWYAGSHIPLMETLSDEQLLEGQRHLVNKFLAPHFNVTMPDGITRSSWHTNPHFRGTNSYESVKGLKFQDKLAKPLLNQHDIPTLLFAGEATHPYYFSTVHGAIETGYREAERLINLYQKS